MDNSSGARTDWLTRIAGALVFLYALIKISAPDIAEDVIVLGALLAWIAIFIRDRQLLKSFVVVCFVTAIVSQLLSWWLSQGLAPELVERSPKVHRLALWFYCIPVAYILKGRQQRITALFLLASAGLLSAPWIVGNGWEELRLAFSGRRINFGIHNAQHTAMFFGVLLLGLLCFWRPIINPQSRWRWLRLALWLTTLVFCIACVFFTQTRGVWLSLIGAGLAAYLLALLNTGNSWLAVRNRILIPTALLAIIGTGAWQAGMLDLVSKRISSDRATLSTYWNDSEQLGSANSISIRLSTWSESLVWIEKRPWFGWGGKGRRFVINQTDHLSDARKKQFGHLHNSYLDTATNYGLLGLSVMLALLGFLAYATYCGWKRKTIGNNAALFFSTFIVYWLIVNIFESYMFFSSGIYILAVVSGAIISLYWQSEQLRGEFKALNLSTDTAPIVVVPR